MFTFFCVLISIGVILAIFLFRGNFYWIGIVSLLLIMSFLALAIFFIHLCSKQIIFRDDKIIIIRNTGFRKVVDVKDMLDIHIHELPDAISQSKKNKGTYYGVYFKLKNGKSIMVSENIHITTLINFLKGILKYYDNKLPPRCISHIQEFMMEKEEILKRFQRGNGK